MTIKRLDHVSVVVDDLAAAMAFFTELGMTREGEASVEGPWVDRVNGLEGVPVDIVMMRTPDGHGRRQLRLPRLGHQARLFVHLDPLLARDRRDQLANCFERQIVRRLEMNATLPHVELLPGRLERRLQLFELTRTPERAHQVERAVVL